METEFPYTIFNVQACIDASSHLWCFIIIIVIIIIIIIIIIED